MAKQYENVFRAKHSLYARTYDTETKESTLETVKFIPSIYISTNEDSELTSVPENQNLQELTYKNMGDFRDALNLYKASNVPVSGNKSQEFGYIREQWVNPIDCFHDFHTWFWDIEVGNGELDPNIDKLTQKNDWKPMGHERAAMAKVTSIQIYDSKFKEYYIFGLEKEWKNTNGFVSEHGKINYWKMSSEENMLKAFIKLLAARKPAIMSGWNTSGYDDPYIVNRVIRVLDKRDDLYYFDKIKNRWMFNRDCLTGGYVQQLSPVGLVTQKEVETSFGIQDEFKWAGIIMEDYKVLYHKYTYASLTSYSLDSVATYELGSNKVQHDEFVDFGEFYKQDYNKFIEYGIQDVSLLIEIDRKLKLIDLAKFIAYTCGVTMDDIRGTVKQWNNYMYNNHLNAKMVLPMEGRFGKTDSVILKHASKMDELPLAKKTKYARLLSDVEYHGQTFPGGITRGTGRLWKEVFSLDFGSLYPSCIQWANIGIETLIQPKDLPKELLDLRAKYAIYYEKGVLAKELIQFDIEFTQNVLGNPEIMKEISETLKKYNVSMTPNGMFFKSDKRSILSQTMEDIIVQRKVYKGEMKGHFKEMQKIKDEKKDGWEQAYEISSALADKANVYQMGLKILVNSAYGSLSMGSTVFAGDKEYFSGAVTSSSRIANLIAGQVNSKKIDSIVGTEAKEMQFGMKSYMDHIPQQDTDSNYISIEPIVIKKFGEDYRETNDRSRLTKFTENYINKVSLPITYEALNDIYSATLNAKMPEKLIEDPEVICDNFISIVPKMYFARKWWDEGLTLTKPKLKVTGLSMVRSTTPKFYRQELEKAMEILIDGDIPKVIEYCNGVEEESKKQDPKEISINQGVSSLDYSWDETLKKFRRWVPEKQKWLSAPVNSRASLIHNKYVTDKKIEGIKDIEPGDKIAFCYMKVPNITGSNAFAFQEQKVFDSGLKEYIDYDLMYEKGFMNNIRLITDPLKWDLTPEDDLIDDDEW